MTSVRRLAPRGFSLLEVLVAVSIVAALVGMMFAFLSNVLSSRSRVLEHSDRQRAATALIERIEADLMTCIVGDQSFGAGVQGDATHLAILTQSVSPMLPGVTEEDPRVQRDLQLAEYRFDGQRRVAQGRRSCASLQESTSTDAAAASVAGASQTEAGRGRMQGAGFDGFGGDIPSVRFRYHDGVQWRDSFDSLESGHLPRAVEIAVWFTAPLPDAFVDPSVASIAPIGGLREADRGSVAFDEERHAILSDVEAADERTPDRVRVIVVPDSQASDEPAGSIGAGESQP
jgi:prepilin-type N-terminal cleavage/methylation domain-containing protein